MEATTRMQPAGERPTDSLRIVRPPEEVSGFSLAPSGTPPAPSPAQPPKLEAEPDPAPASEPRGLRCRHCGCGHFHVYYTRPHRDGSVFRRRECRNCGRMMSTRERPV